MIVISGCSMAPCTNPKIAEARALELGQQWRRLTQHHRQAHTEKSQAIDEKCQGL
jgi:hypothetical protein